MSLVIDSFNPDVWGYIKDGVSAHDFTGTEWNPNVQQGDSVDPVEWRAYYSFDTSSIPGGVVLDLARFTCETHSVTEPIGYNGTYVVGLYYDHDIIGGALDLGDYGFPTGNYWGSKSWASNPGSSAVFTIDATDFSCINIDGDTDCELRDVGGFTDPPGSLLWRFKGWRSKGGYRCYLQVGYVRQGALNKLPSGNLTFYGGCLMALSRLLMAEGIIPPNSRVDRVDGADIHVVTRFAPRMA